MALLSNASRQCTSRLVQPPEIFDRALRRLRRDRAASHFAAHDFLRAHMIEEILDRLDSVKRSFTRALDLGACDGALGKALRARGIEVVSADPGRAFADALGGVQCDEDRLPFADSSFDLIVQAGGLESVNDVPGALTLARRALMPDGLYLGALVGSGSLPALKAAMLAADMDVGDAVHARTHPQIDVRAAGDLLSRAGFALPVADTARLTVRYRDVFRLFTDLRGMAATNLLRGERSPITRRWLAAATQAFAKGADADGKISEHFEIVCLTGWSPSPDQPKAARRGSATTSLAAILKPGG
ncbi:class I SAM-dependent methyltransferase [Sphingomonas cavernae]|uniref:Methyltransferase domain-containing protein n=1 Tax=Sphingomonas cavernae TaxID=2320861 RepID=A0A418WP74_9SPHN|nr:class I SAM-dependent methyltransferase [Sphingomonas cavernae]RJF93023.1 methyltransferase domain-containing protein [Sphingomonas cavernae]